MNVVVLGVIIMVQHIYGWQTSTHWQLSTCWVIDRPTEYYYLTRPMDDDGNTILPAAVLRGRVVDFQDQESYVRELWHFQNGWQLECENLCLDIIRVIEPAEIRIKWPVIRADPLLEGLIRVPWFFGPPRRLNASDFFHLWKQYMNRINDSLRIIECRRWKPRNHFWPSVGCSM